MVMSVKLTWLRLVQHKGPVISPRLKTKTKTRTKAMPKTFIAGKTTNIT